MGLIPPPPLWTMLKKTALLVEDGFPNCRGPLWDGLFFYFRKCPFEYDFVEHRSPIINIAFQFIFLLRQTIFSSDLTRISEQKTKVVPWWCVVGLGLTSWLYWHLRWKLKCSNLDRSCPSAHKLRVTVANKKTILAFSHITRVECTVSKTYRDLLANR